MTAQSIFSIGDKVNGTFSKLAFQGVVIGFAFNGHCVRIAVDNPAVNLPAVPGSQPGIKVLTFNPNSANVTYGK